LVKQQIYGRSSPYWNTNIVNGKFLDVLQYRQIIAEQDDVLMTITPVYEYRPDLLAFDLYGNPQLWWVFAARNPNVLGPDPYFNMKAGTKIYIPKQSNIQRSLGN
jgi:alpha-L-fucosidase